MTYSGYEIWRCVNGHDEFFDAFETPEYDWRCPECGARVKWKKQVDQTNVPEVAYDFQEVDERGFYVES